MVKRIVQKAERAFAWVMPSGVRKGSNQVVLPSPSSRDQWFWGNYTLGIVIGKERKRERDTYIPFFFAYFGGFLVVISLAVTGEVQQLV